MTEPKKNPDRLAGTNQGSESKRNISTHSKEIISRFPISAKPPNLKKFIQVDGKTYTAQEFAKLSQTSRADQNPVFHPVKPPLTSERESTGVLAQAGRDPSLSLLRNISTENPPKQSQNQTENPIVRPQKSAPKGLNTSHKKTKNALVENVDYLTQTHGIENLGFLTLTFRDHVTDPKEAQRRFNSLATHVLSIRYQSYIRVIERQKSGRIHYHLLVVLDQDIRTGFDFNGIKNHDYSSASKPLKHEWAYWRKTAPLYGFGRTELLPIKTSGRGMALYVGKYIAKHVDQRKPEDKGIRLVSYGGNSRNWTSKHTPLDYPSTQWRYKVETFARQIRKSKNHLCHGLADLNRIMGKNWAFKHRAYIMTLEPTDPSCPF
jgi:hypothetical protein